MYITTYIHLHVHNYIHTSTSVYRILSEHPIAVCGIAADLVRRLSPFVHQVDFALDWMDLEAGKALYRYMYMYLYIICTCISSTYTLYMYKMYIICTVHIVLHVHVHVQYYM